MTEQSTLLKLMIEQEIKKQDKNVRCAISNHLYIAPTEVKLEADEIAFISFIRIDAGSDFTLRFGSAAESRKIERIVPATTIIEYNIITKHLGTIKFNMSNSDNYEVSVIKIKFIK